MTYSAKPDVSENKEMNFNDLRDELIYFPFIVSDKEIMFLVSVVCSSVCLSVCL